MPLHWAERQTRGAVRSGVSLDELFAKALIVPKFGDQRDTISPLQYALLCMSTTLALGDATHGMARTAVDVPFTAIGLRMALGCANLEGAILALARLYSLASEAVCIQLQTEQDIAILSVHLQAADEEDAAYLEENYLCWTFMQMLYFLGKAPAVSKVVLRDPRHFCLGMEHWAIPGWVYHGEVTQIEFPLRYLSEASVARAGDNVIFDCHKPWFAHLLDDATNSFSDFVGRPDFVVSRI